MLTLDKVYHAAFVLKNTVRRTDLIYSPVLSDGYELYLKTENLQLTGSFKLRGSAYKISQLTPRFSPPMARRTGTTPQTAAFSTSLLTAISSRAGVKRCFSARGSSNTTVH